MIMVGQASIAMNPELTRAEITELVAENLRQHASQPSPVSLNSNQASECRKLIIELLDLSPPKSIIHFTPLPAIIQAVNKIP